MKVHKSATPIPTSTPTLGADSPTGAPKVDRTSDELVASGHGTSNGLKATAPTHKRSAAAGSTGKVGPGLKVPGEPQVQNKSLAKSLKRARKTLKKGLDAFATRGADNAYPKVLGTRREVWAAVDDLTGRHTSRETPELAAAIDALQEFSQRWQSSGDEMNMPGIANGTAFQRANGDLDRHPGLRQLSAAVFAAAGMTEKA